MFNDRDLAIIGIGAVVSVFCLVLPVSFTWKVVLGLCVLILSMVGAFLRLGRDHLTLEEWFKRRFRYLMRPKFWAFYERNLPVKPWPEQRQSQGSEKSEPQTENAVDGIPRGKQALVFAFQVPNVGKVFAVLLVIVGAYFLYGLWIGGLEDIAHFIGGVLP